MKRYLVIYWHILKFHLKSMLEYRLNFLIQMIYGPMYVLVLYMLLQTALSRTPTLGGWNRDELMMLFASFHLLYTICILLFFKGIRHLLWEAIQKGDVDTVLTKPLSPLFLIAFGKPEIQQLLLLLGVSILFIKQFSALASTLEPLNVLLFLVLFTLGIVIAFLSITTYGAVGFFITKSRQVIEFFDKVADFSQYPTPIFPAAFQAVLFMIVPVAFFSYIPTSFLLGKGSSQLFVTTLVVLVGMFITNRVMWKAGLKRYSSASS